MKNKILLMDKKGQYALAQKSKDELTLKPSQERVDAREVVPYGLEFKFGDIGEINFGICGYYHTFYRGKGKNGGLPLDHEEHGRINLDLTIKGLENEVKKAGADYILVDFLEYGDMGTIWKFSGRAQLLIKR
jgi:hypothetical protein